MKGEIAQPAWQLTQLLERPASVAHHDGFWNVVVERGSGAAETLDDALEAAGAGQSDSAEAVVPG